MGGIGTAPPVTAPGTSGCAFAGNAVLPVLGAGLVVGEVVVLGAVDEVLGAVDEVLGVVPGAVVGSVGVTVLPVAGVVGEVGEVGGAGGTTGAGGVCALVDALRVSRQPKKTARARRDKRWGMSNRGRLEAGGMDASIAEVFRAPLEQRGTKRFKR